MAQQLMVSSERHTWQGVPREGPQAFQQFVFCAIVVAHESIAAQLGKALCHSPAGMTPEEETRAGGRCAA